MSSDRPKRASAPTRPGHGGSEGETGPSSEQAERPSRPSYDHRPIVEIEVVQKRGPIPTSADPLRTVEVWTQHRLYVMDPNMVCVEVSDLETHAVDKENEFLGHRLVGGQHREGETIELSYPFPRPGTEAVFEKVGPEGESLSRTSTVSRVVLRLHVVTADPKGVVPTWAELRRASMRPSGDPGRG